MGEKITEQKIEYPQFDSITSKHSIKSISSNNITLSFGTRSTMPSCEVKLKKTDELFSKFMNFFQNWSFLENNEFLFKIGSFLFQTRCFLNPVIFLKFGFLLEN